MLSSFLVIRRDRKKLNYVKLWEADGHPVN